MSDLEKRAALQTDVIKKAYPDPSILLSRKISSLATTWVSDGKCAQTNTTGVRSITITPLVTASCTGVLFCWGAPDGAIGDLLVAAWFADATTDVDQLQIVFIPAGATYTKSFDTPITRWDYQAVGAATAAYQEVQL